MTLLPAVGSTRMGVMYVAALIVGLGITGLQLLLSSGGDGHHGDVGHGHGHGHDDDGDHHAGGGGLLAVFLSVRFWTYGLLGFGLLGTLLHFLNLAPALVVAVCAVLTGIGSGGFASWAFRAIARTSVGSGGETGDLLGQVGTVLVRLEPGRRGKVRLEVRGRTLDYLATTDAGELAAGEQVLIEEVDGNEVRVGRVPPELGS